jgi:hypothetical protein
VEWTALLLLVVAVLLGAVGAVVETAAPAAGLARALRCAVLAGCHGEDAELQAAYGGEVAGLVRAFAPGLDYEPGTLTLPVDFRACRTHRCADAPDRVRSDVWRSARGARATAFTHVVRRGGEVYIQYWLYYPDSTWNGRAYALGRALRHTPTGWLAGRLAGHHDDDWESYQVRITASGAVLARSSAHNGYAGGRHWPEVDQLPFELPSPAWRATGVRLRRRHGNWVAPSGWTHVSRGSHAGFVPAGPGDDRRTASDGVALVPIERLDAAARATDFAIVPPWRKPVYREPDRNDT